MHSAERARVKAPCSRLARLAAEARHVARRGARRTVSRSHGGSGAAGRQHQRAPDSQIWGTLVAPPPPSSHPGSILAADRSDHSKDCPAGPPALPWWAWWGRGVAPSGQVGREGLSAASCRHEIRSERQCVQRRLLRSCEQHAYAGTAPHTCRPGLPGGPGVPLGFPCALLS